jgi:nitrate/nitrite transporter NarK
MAVTSAEVNTPSIAGNAHYSWVALFIVWGAFLLSYVDRVAWGTVSVSVGASIGIQVSLLGAFLTAFYCGYVVANLICGALCDFLGGRVMTTASMLMLGVATFCFGSTTSLTVGIFIQIAMGFSAGADYSAGMKIIPSWFRKDRGRAMGIFVTATSLASILANMIVPSLSQSYGWQTAFKCLGLATLAWAIVAGLFLRNRPMIETSEPVKLREMLALFRNRNMIVLALSGFGALWATVGFTGWGNALMTKTYGISPVAVGHIMAAFGIGALLAKPIRGSISDIPGISRKTVLIITLLMFAITLAVFGNCTTMTAFYIVAPILGVFSFGYLPVIMAAASDTTGRRVAGATAGITNAIWQAGGAVSPLVVGKVFANSHSIGYALIALAIGPVFAVFGLLFFQNKK